MVLLVAALRSVLSAEVAGTGSAAAVTTPPEADRLRSSFGEAVARHRVGHLLAPHAAALGMSEAVIADLRESQRRSTLGAMACATGTIHVSAALARAGIPHLILKGVALAQQTTGSPLGRGRGDVDVLVDPRDIPGVVRTLADSGLQFDGSFCPPPESPLFGPTLRTQMELVMLLRGGEVDVHWRLDAAADCLGLGFAELAGRAEDIPLGGRAIPTLGRRDAALFNATHGARDAWSSLRSIVDQVRLIRGLEPDRLTESAYAVGAGGRMDWALAMAARLTGGPPPRLTGGPPARVARSADAWAERAWRWILDGSAPRARTGLRPSARLFGANLLTYDTPRAAAQRAGTLVWPVRAMAARSLGDVGDRHPWLYPAATPYFLGRRAMAKVGLIEQGR
jgi:hypothetical protein